MNVAFVRLGSIPAYFLCAFNFRGRGGQASAFQLCPDMGWIPRAIGRFEILLKTGLEIPSVSEMTSRESSSGSVGRRGPDYQGCQKHNRKCPPPPRNEFGHSAGQSCWWVVGGCTGPLAGPPQRATGRAECGLWSRQYTSLVHSALTHAALVLYNL